MEKQFNCEHCGREMKPAPGKLHASGEQSYIGYNACPCKRPIMTDYGVVFPGTEEHSILMKSGQYDVNSLLNPINWNHPTRRDKYGI
mgnify:CR=1 FL=1